MLRHINRFWEAVVTVVADELFDRETARDGFTEVPEGISRDRRRTLLRLISIERKVHPITTLPIHPDAPLDASSKDRFPRPQTCGTCIHRIKVNFGTERSYPKCDLLTKERLAARTAATDTPRWMPACVGYAPTEGYVWK